MQVSVVTASFNQGQYIERTLLSVLSQDWKCTEYVVFDGGSTDETLHILRKYAANVRWYSEPDTGQANAINKGIQATTGEIVAWLNSDDVYYPGAVRAVMEYFIAHPEVDVIYGMADHIDQNDKPFEDYPTEPWDFERLKFTCFLCQPAVFLRRKMFATYGLLNENLKYCMDYEYWLRLGAAGVSFAYLPRKLAGSRLYQENKTMGARVKVHAEINDMFLRRFNRVPDRWLYNYAHAVVERRWDRNQSPKRFHVDLWLQCMFAAIYWNKKISPEMAQTTSTWILPNVFGR
jgi:glycosyltransferase involved in cell wall biosynthesis